MASRIEDYGLIGNTRTARSCRAADRSTGCARRASTRTPASRRWSATTSTAPGRCAPRCGCANRSSAIATTAWCWRRVRSATAAPFASSTSCRWPTAATSSASSKASTARCRSRCCSTVRFGYGADWPLIEMTKDGTRFLAGPDALILRGPLSLTQVGRRVSSQLQVRKGDRIPLQLTWFPSHLRAARLASTPSRRWRRPTRSGGSGRAAARTRGGGATPCCARC